MMPRAIGEITDRCRNFSRACTFEMCSSMTGTLAEVVHGANRLAGADERAEFVEPVDQLAFIVGLLEVDV